MMTIVVVTQDDHIHIFTGIGFHIGKEDLTIQHKDNFLSAYPLSDVKYIKGEEIDES